MIKADKRITGHITKNVHPVKVQSYADDTTIIINQRNEMKYVYEIYGKHSRASEAAINLEKTQIFRLGDRNVLTKWEHDEFTKKVKNKVTILGAVFCRDKGQETCENLQKATKTVEKLQNSTGKFISLAGKILRLNTYVFSTVWNNAWMINIKNYHFRQFITQIEKYLCEFKGKEILGKVSKRREEGGLGLINVKERIQEIQALEFLKADIQKPETDNLLFEVGWKQKALYGRMFHGGKSEKAKDIITVICDKIDEIKRFKMNHKSVKAKNIQDIIFPKRKMTFFKEIYDPIEPKLMSTNYLMLHGLLLIRGNSPCNLCKKTEDGIHHILFNCASLAQTRGFVQGCLQQIGINNFDQFNITEMTGMKDMANYIISLYKDTIWKTRRASFSRKINDETVMKSIDYNIRFYVNHIMGK